MATQPNRADRLVRTSVLLPLETDEALRDLAAKGNRPLSREIRQAVEDHVDRSRRRKAA